MPQKGSTVIDEQTGEKYHVEIKDELILGYHNGIEPERSINAKKNPRKYLKFIN